MKLYHFTKKENLSGVLANGLIAKSNFSSLNCIIRENVVFAWILPEHDLMGYIQNNEYILFEIEVESERCLVANMDYISSAYVNHVINHLDVVSEMTNAYMSTAISPQKYINGHFRSPEVLIKGSIIPEDVKYISNCAKENLNLQAYLYKNREYELFANSSITSQDIEKLGLKLVAVHDDSTGILGTFKDVRHLNYYTINLNGDLKTKLTKIFFGDY